MEAKLTWDTIGHLDDGRAGAIINAVIASAIADTEDRGGDEKPREVHVCIRMEKIKGLFAMEVEAKAKLPTYRTDRTAGRIVFEQGKRGQQPVILFQDMAPDNPHQDTIDKHLGDK